MSKKKEEVVPLVKQPEHMITLEDIANATQIIDVAAKRGSFSASEFEHIGALHKKFTLFINANTPKDPPEEQHVPSKPSIEGSNAA